jgi:SAM-dependent methyltransferase
MREHRLYDDLVELWPLVSDPAEYREEADLWRQVLRDHLGPGRHPILELGVGGGHNLSHLTAEFDATAVDLSPGMLAHSRRLNPTVRHVEGDMRTVRLDATFAAVLVHDAASYLRSLADLQQTMATARTHLRPGGVLLMAPDHVTETFVDGRLNHATHTVGDRTVTLIDYSYDPDPDDSEVEFLMLYLIRDGTASPRVEQDLHRLGLHPKQTWIDQLTAAGFTVEVREHPGCVPGETGFLFVGIL